MTGTADEAAVREGAAIGAISARAQIAVAGQDRATYLQGLLTNDIVSLAEGTGCYAAWLSPQGRMLTDMHVLQSAGMILLDVPLAEVNAVLARLEQFLFSEDVRIESLAEAMTGIWLHGPQAESVISKVVSGLLVRRSPTGEGGSRTAPGEWLDYQHDTGTFDGNPVSVARIDQLGVPGYCVFLARALETQFVAAAIEAGARAVGAEVLDAARIEAGYPLFGVDMTDDTIPLEAGIDQRAISFTKGCFVGQEVVIRVLHRGGGRVVKKLVGFKLTTTADVQSVGHPFKGADGPSVGHPFKGADGPNVGHPFKGADGPNVGHPFKGARVFSGEREIGVLTSVATSPRLGVIALGYVHRDFTSPGTGVQVDGHPATVVGLPMA